MRSKVIVDRTPHLDPSVDVDGAGFQAQARQCFKLATQATDHKAAEALEMLGAEFAVRARARRSPRASRAERDHTPPVQRKARQSIDGLPPREPSVAKFRQR